MVELTETRFYIQENGVSIAVQEDKVNFTDLNLNSVSMSIDDFKSLFHLIESLGY